MKQELDSYVVSYHPLFKELEQTIQDIRTFLEDAKAEKLRVDCQLTVTPTHFLAVLLGHREVPEPNPLTLEQAEIHAAALAQVRSSRPNPPSPPTDNPTNNPTPREIAEEAHRQERMMEQLKQNPPPDLDTPIG